MVNRIGRVVGGLGLAVLFCAPVLAETIGIAATVNEGVITTTDVSERRDLVMATSNIPNTPENVQHITPRIVQMLIEETLELQEAKHQSLTVTQEELDKAINELPASKDLPPGGLKKQLEAKGLSSRSLENQIRAKLAWNKVVQRKLRRNVVVSKDELIRAQQAEANAPDINEIRLAALIVPVEPEKETQAQALAKEISEALNSGHDFTAVAEKYHATAGIKFNPPIWVVEENMPADVQQSLRAVKTGTVSQPLRTSNSIQFVKIFDRRSTKRPSASTEVTIKQITIDIPPKPDKAVLDKLAESETIVRANPGTCEDPSVPPTPLPAVAAFAHLTMGALSTEQRSIIARMDVGSVSESLVTPEHMRVVLLCERSESSGSAKELEALRQQLFSEKLELESQKSLRNLRRDASIDIRGDK